MKKLVNNDKYEIAVDQKKNRVYFKIKGFWKDPSDIPNYIADWEMTLQHLKPHFTIVSDLREMKPHSTSLTPVHEKAQRLLVSAGLDRTAEIMGDAVLLEFQTKQYAERSLMKKMEFETLEEAEAWLDSDA